MKQVKKHIVPLFALIIYEVCYFIFAPYPKSLFDVKMINSAYKYIPDFITKLVLFIIYISIVILICKYIFLGEKFIFMCEYFKNIFISVAFMLPLRLIFDIFLCITPPIKYSYAEQFIIDLLFNIILFIFIFKKKGFKNTFNKKTAYLIFFTALISILYIIISVYKITQNIEFMNYINKKYSVIINQDELKNYSFEISLYTLLFNVISIVMIYFIFNSMAVSTASSDTRKGKITARIFSIIIAFFLLFVIKAFSTPKGLLHKIKVEGAETIHYQEKKKYDKNTKNLKVYRSNGYNEDTLVYSKRTVYITYENKTIAKIKNNNLQEVGKIIDHGNDIFSYDTQAIMYTENNKPFCILSKDVKKQKENQKLTQVLEQLIDSGYFEFLEYSYEYMLKYDKKFLEAYLKTYVQGNYDENINNNIEKDYIIEFSQNALKNDF